MKRALRLVDIQNDFLPGGALAGPEGDAILPVVNAIQDRFDLVVATQDFHPADHGSFASNHATGGLYEVVDLNGLDQVLWPDHCVQGTAGVEFSPELNMDRVEHVFPKGTDTGIDSYSGFFDNGRRKSTGLGDYLQEQGVDEVYVVGLATDYCVKATAMDAASLGFATTVVSDAVRGVNVNPDDSEKAFLEMQEAGVQVRNSEELMAAVG